MDDAHVPCRCGCPRAAAAHAVAAALADDDLDRALQHGLLDCVACAGCSADCTRSLLIARGQRQRALDARQRFRQREARLAQRQRARDARRNTSPDAAAAPGNAAGSPSLPPAAAAALARAKAKAAGHSRT